MPHEKSLHTILSGVNLVELAEDEDDGETRTGEDRAGDKEDSAVAAASTVEIRSKKREAAEAEIPISHRSYLLSNGENVQKKTKKRIERKSIIIVEEYAHIQRLLRQSPMQSMLSEKTSTIQWLF